MSVRLDHFDMINILCILLGCFSQHAWMSSWEPRSMEVKATHEWIADVGIHTHFCAGSRCASSLLLRCSLGVSKICRCDSIARQWKKTLACHDHVQFRRDLHSGSWLHLVKSIYYVSMRYNAIEYNMMQSNMI